MEGQMIIAVGREFGSGGHYIAEKIANDLKIAYYDRNFLESVANEQNVSMEYLEKFDEKRKKIILSRNVKGYTNSLEEIVAEMQFEWMRKKADTGEAFVIVGRCADEIFRGDSRLVSIFILGDKDDKIRRVSERHNISRLEAYSKILKSDKGRKAYHNRFSKMKWGNPQGYDICMNSSRLGINKTAEILENYIKERNR